MSTPYTQAREAYAALGIDTEAVLTQLAQIPVSLHCWQGDDVAGFEKSSEGLGSGLVATGNYPGRARNFAELSADLEQVARLVPGRHRINLHACYATDNPARVDRDALEFSHFKSWLDWAKARGWGVDFNPSCFGHPLAASGSTLTSRDEGVRNFWIRHCEASRAIGAAFGAALQDRCVTNIWIPDGSKDIPADRTGPRERLLASLDSILAKAPADAKWNIDTVESKLFGIGVESYTAGSHEFYLGYAIKRGIGYCLDAGHFHPTEGIADKVSSILLFVPHLLLHVSRGVRWDSDHVVILDDPTREALAEVARSGAFDRISVGMDFFDASINRIAAWAIGGRSTKKALLLGLLTPSATLVSLENSGDLAGRLGMMEDLRSLPWGAVWNEFCARSNVPGDGAWMEGVRNYEKTVLSRRS